MNEACTPIVGEGTAPPGASPAAVRDSRAPLTHEETMTLILAAHDGDTTAEETLVQRNLALVKSIVKKYLGRGVEYDDLFQLGCMGLVKAIQHFNTAYDVRFSTYAVPM